MRDLGYRKKEKQTKGKEEEEKVNFLREFDEMLVKKRTKLANMMIEKDDLTSEIATATGENKVMDRMISELEEEEIKMKSRIKEALNHHKICKK